MAAAVCLAACTNDPMTSDDVTDVPPPAEETADAVQPTLSTAALGSFASSQNRVVLAPQTRATSGSLVEIATIENLSKEAGKVPGFTVEPNGRYLSATCVYYDQTTGTYYATYHMQGNNYNTQQEVETKGFIESFKIVDGEPVLENVYYSEGPDFDFNHLYFDDMTNNRWSNSNGPTSIIAVGHKSEPSSKEGGEPNTAAIIAKLDLDLGQIQYSTVLTGDKLRDAAGRSLGDEDAGDVNCVIRKWDHFLLATRKGLAVLNATPDNLFVPAKADDKDVYFIKTPGSAKHICHSPGATSNLAFLYLTQDTPKDFDATTAIPANIVDFSFNSLDGSVNSRGVAAGNFRIGNVVDFDWSTLPQTEKCLVFPVDGKNVLTQEEERNYTTCACLGKGGLYVKSKNYDFPYEEVLTFSDVEEGSRPVNGVFFEPGESYNGRSATNGFIYVANGRCLTILDAGTLETVADYTIGLKDKAGNAIDASANYVQVVQTGTSTNEGSPDRIITVAYGQAGVKVFKFVPPTKL